MKRLYVLFVVICFSIFGFSQSREVPVLKHSQSLVIKELTQLNSTYRDINITISPDGKYLYFMSDRGGQSWSSYPSTFDGKPSYDGDIWYSVKVRGVWQKPKCLSKRINTYSGEDEPNVSADGQRVTFESWKSNWKTTGGPYYTSELNGATWGTPVGLGGGITSFFIGEYNKSYYYATDGMSISPDGNTFIVACGRDYDGNLDLFIAHKERNIWQKPQKMNISTDKDERSIFIAGDGHTIFFASDGYGGYGGLDIFMGTIDDKGKCTNIKNIGKPFNTAKDDYGFIITASGTEAYFVRDGDIYFASLPPNNELTPQPTVIVKGILTDCSSIPLEMYLFLEDKSGNKIANSKTSINGEFIFTFPEKSGNYNIYDAENNLLKTFKVKKLDKYQEIEFDIKNCNKRKQPTKRADKE